LFPVIKIPTPIFLSNVIIRQLLYFIKKAIQNIRVFFVINLITIGIISLSLIVLSTFLMISLNLEHCLDKWKSQINVTAYLKKAITPEELTLVKQKITDFHEVKKISFVSREEALSLLKDTFPGQSGVFEELKDNPLPASIEIQLKEEYNNPQTIKNFAVKVEKIPAIDEIEYGRIWIKGYAAFFNFVKSAIVAVGAVILLATVFIISNTIKLTVYARKEEIEIMKLVGASNFFIRTPFFIEGIFQGLLGAFVALLALYAGYHVFTNWMAHSSFLPLQFMQISFLPLKYVILIGVGGMVTGFLGSFFSLGRYLKI